VDHRYDKMGLIVLQCSLTITHYYWSWWKQKDFNGSAS